MYTITIENGWINIQNTTDDSLQSIEVSGLHLSNKEDHVALRGSGSLVMLHPTLIDEINGAPIDGETVAELIAIIQVAAVLPSDGGTLDLVDITATAGTTLTSASLSGKTAHLVIWDNTLASTGFALVGTTITFSDGTTFAGGESVKVLVS